MTGRTPSRRAITGDDCATALRALAEPSRLELLRECRAEERSVGELCAALGAAHHFVSRHLAVLRAAGLVSARRDGRRVLYRLAPALSGRGSDAIDLGCCELRFPGSA